MAFVSVAVNYKASWYLSRWKVLDCLLIQPYSNGLNSFQTFEPPIFYRAGASGGAKSQHRGNRERRDLSRITPEYISKVPLFVPAFYIFPFPCSRGAGDLLWQFQATSLQQRNLSYFFTIRKRKTVIIYKTSTVHLNLTESSGISWALSSHFRD